MRATSKFFNVLAILSLMALLLVNCAGGNVGGSPIVIAFAGADFRDAAGNINSQSAFAGIRMAVDEINRLGGIHGRPIQLAEYDDKKNVAMAQDAAKKIVASDAVLVIGHSNAETSEAAATVYDEGKMPALNAVPGTSQLPIEHYYYYNAVFTVETQAIYLANYLHKVQGWDHVNIIFGEDIYSTALTNQFANTFRGLGGKINHQFNAQGKSSAATVNEILSWRLDAEKTEPLFISLSEPAASALVVAMRRNGVNYPIVGANNLSSPDFLRAMAAQSEEKARPGYFTDGILTTRALIFDSADEDAVRFSENFQKIHAGGEPSDEAVRGYEAALTALEALRRAELSGTDAERNREKVVRALFMMDENSSTFNGLTGPIAFDQLGNLIRSARFGIFSNGVIISAMIQFDPIISPANVVNLQDLLRKGRVATVGGKYVYVVNIVYTGIDVISIRDIDTQNSTYLLDFYLWFRYRPNPDDPDLKPDDYAFTNVQSDPTTVLISNIQPQPGDRNGVAYIAYRVTGVFKNEFDFRAYPFDYQDLTARLRNQHADTTSIQYVVDHIGLRAIHINDLFNHWQDNGTFNALYGWRPEKAQAFQSIFSANSTVGNPQRFEQQETTNYSLFNVTLTVRRIAQEYLIKTLLPLLLTLLLAYISFYLPLGHSERFGVGSTALMTTAFFHLNLATSLPQIGYRVLMDFFFYVSYGLSVLIIILETTSIQLEKRGETETDEAKKTKLQKRRVQLNLLGRIVYPIIVAITYFMGEMVFYKVIVWPPVDMAALRTPVTDIYNLEVAPTPIVVASGQTRKSQERFTLRLASWRPEDTQQYQAILDAFHEYALQEYKEDIRIEYVPVMSTRYDTILQNQFQHKIGPDLFYVRPFTVDSSISTYLLALRDEALVARMESQYSEEKLKPWHSVWDTYYAVPFVGVVQGVYYNKEVFQRLGLTVPTTWEEFLTVADTLQRANYLPIANGLNITEDSEMFMSIIANYVGDNNQQLKKESDLCFDGPQIVNAFRAIENILPYLPADAANLNSKTSKQLFRDQQAIMLFGGSWDVKEFSDVKFEWSIFPAPAPRGSQTVVIFQPDVGIGVNQDTPYPKEALMFLNWLMDKQSAAVLTTNLPGFYPLGNTESGTSANTQDAAFLRMATDYPTDVRWVFNTISDQYPRASDIVRQSLHEMALGNLTAAEAATRLQNGLAEWYEPAQSCR